jgi:hypothetical protein
VPDDEVKCEIGRRARPRLQTENVLLSGLIKVCIITAAAEARAARTPRGWKCQRGVIRIQLSAQFYPSPRRQSPSQHGGTRRTSILRWKKDSQSACASAWESRVTQTVRPLHSPRITGKGTKRSLRPRCLAPMKILVYTVLVLVVNSNVKSYSTREHPSSPGSTSTERVVTSRLCRALLVKRSQTCGIVSA